jgi:hypothetical protein
LEKKAKPKLVHLAFGERYPRGAACAAKSAATAKKNRRGYSYSRPGRSTTRVTDKLEEVTCPRCKKLIGEETKAAEVIAELKTQLETNR